VPTLSSTKQRSLKMAKRISRIHSPRPISAEGPTPGMTAKQERSYDFDNARTLFIQARRLREARLTQSDSVTHGLKVSNLDLDTGCSTGDSGVKFCTPFPRSIRSSVCRIYRKTGVVTCAGHQQLLRSQRGRLGFIAISWAST